MPRRTYLVSIITVFAALATVLTLYMDATPDPGDLAVATAIAMQANAEEEIAVVDLASALLLREECEVTTLTDETSTTVNNGNGTSTTTTVTETQDVLKCMPELYRTPTPAVIVNNPPFPEMVNANFAVQTAVAALQIPVGEAHDIRPLATATPTPTPTPTATPTPTPTPTPPLLVGWSAGTTPTSDELDAGEEFGAPSTGGFSPVTFYRGTVPEPNSNTFRYVWFAAPIYLGTPQELNWGSGSADSLGGFTRLQNVEIRNVQNVLYRTTAEQSATIENLRIQLLYYAVRTGEAIVGWSVAGQPTAEEFDQGVLTPYDGVVPSSAVNGRVWFAVPVSEGHPDRLRFGNRVGRFGRDGAPPQGWKEGVSISEHQIWYTNSDQSLPDVGTGSYNIDILFLVEDGP